MFWLFFHAYQIWASQLLLSLKKFKKNNAIIKDKRMTMKEEKTFQFSATPKNKKGAKQPHTSPHIRPPRTTTNKINLDFQTV